MLIHRPTISISERVLQSDLLRSVPGVRHGVSSRIEGLGAAHGNVAYSPPRDQDDAWAMRQMWCAEIGVDPTDLVTAGQVHGATALIVDASNAGHGARPASGRVGLGDALVTNLAGPVLLTLHADCLPVLLVDPDLPAVAAVHAGWRGTVGDVAGSAVRTMTTKFGSDPRRLLAFLGPAICRDCYDVGCDVSDAWGVAAGDDATVALETRSGSWRFDLQAANRYLLERAGLDPASIDATSICTKCGGNAWFSHRGQGPATGRFGAFISISGTSH